MIDKKSKILLKNRDFILLKHDIKRFTFSFDSSGIKA